MRRLNHGSVCSHSTAAVAAISVVWLHLVNYFIRPSPNYGPPVEAEEAKDNDEAAVEQSKIDNDFVLNLIFVLLLLHIIIIVVVLRLLRAILLGILIIVRWLIGCVLLDLTSIYIFVFLIL